jgi:hypothetical protein
VSEVSKPILRSLVTFSQSVSPPVAAVPEPPVLAGLLGAEQALSSSMPLRIRAQSALRICRLLDRRVTGVLLIDGRE